MFSAGGAKVSGKHSPLRVLRSVDGSGHVGW